MQIRNLDHDNMHISAQVKHKCNPWQIRTIPPQVDNVEKKCPAAGGNGSFACMINLVELIGLEFEPDIQVAQVKFRSGEAR